MSATTRALVTVILAACLLGAIASYTPRLTRALTLQGTVFAGTVTCTLDNSFVHRQTNAAGQTEESTLEEHARTTFVLIQGKPIVATGTYSSRGTQASTDPAQDTQSRNERTLRGSFSGPIEQPNDFTGFESNRPTQLSVYTLQIPVTFTYTQSFSSHGRVLTQNDPPRPQGSISYPDRDTPLPVLTVSEDRPTLSGDVSRDVIDSETHKVDGHDGCTWSLIVVLLNGKPLRGGVSGGNRTITPTASLSPTVTRTPLTGHVPRGPIAATPTTTPTPSVTPTASLSATRTPTSTASPTDTATATPACIQKGVVAAGSARSVPAAAPPVCTQPPYSLDWIMPERYGKDWNGDGLIDYPVSPQRLNVASDYPNSDILIDPPNWPVKLVVSRRNSLPCDPAATYTWHAGNVRFVPDQVLEGGRRTCTFIHIFDAQGPYKVTVDVSKGRYPPGQAKRTVVVRDILIVGLGDSVGSGEGDPDIPAVLNLKRAIWQKAQCHRSAFSYEAVASARIEQADPHTSVTFVHLACSGATITQGLIGDYPGIEPTLGPPLFPQIDRMETIIGRRKPDAVVISIGANDVGFGGIVATCSLKTYLQPCAKQPTLDSVAPLNDKGQLLSLAVPKRLSLLPALYNKLAVRLSQTGIPPDRVFLTEYFDPTHSAAGKICPPVLGMTSADLQWAYDHVVRPLNARVEAAAMLHQWTFVGGISAGFSDRGYCRGTESWIVPILGIDLKGTLLKELRQSGAFHPNEKGHAFIADQLVPILKRSIFINGDPKAGVPTAP